MKNQVCKQNTLLFEFFSFQKTEMTGEAKAT